MNIASLFLFAFVSGITPGPNNTLLLHSGARFGFAQTLPHILGISCGMAVIFLLVGFGLGDLMIAQPWAEPMLYAAATLVIAYLSIRIARSPFPVGGVEARKAWSFTRAAGFQWVNPKIWMMTLGAYGSGLGGGEGWVRVGVVTWVFCLVCIPTMSFWAAFGMRLRGLLENPRSFRALHVGLALMLACSWL